MKLAKTVGLKERPEKEAREKGRVRFSSKSKGLTRLVDEFISRYPDIVDQVDPRVLNFILSL